MPWLVTSQPVLAPFPSMPWQKMNSYLSKLLGLWSDQLRSGSVDQNCLLTFWCCGTPRYGSLRKGWLNIYAWNWLSYAKVLAIHLQKLQTRVSSEAHATTNWCLFCGWPSTALLLLFHWTKWHSLLNSTHHYCSYQGPGLSVRWTDLQLRLFLLISSPSSARGRCAKSVWLLAYLAGACSASPAPPWFAPCRTESSPVNRKPNTHKVLMQVLYTYI